MRLTRKHLGLAACLSLFASLVSADHEWSNADLEGGYSMGIVEFGGIGINGEVPNYTPLEAQGVFSFDGAGHVTGKRVVLREDPGSWAFPRTVQTVQSGTYSIGADGMGEMRVTWTPTLEVTTRSPCPITTLRSEAVETYYVTLTDGAFDFMLKAALSITQCNTLPSSVGTIPYYSSGRATKQERVPCDQGEGDDESYAATRRLMR